jgi:hypothetical protein
MRDKFVVVSKVRDLQLALVWFTHTDAAKIVWDEFDTADANGRSAQDDKEKTTAWVTTSESTHSMDILAHYSSPPNILEAFRLKHSLIVLC